MTSTSDPLRTQLARLLDWHEAHVGFDQAVEGLKPELHGARAAGFDHSPWQLVEHIRLAQKDLLDFCVNPDYVHTLSWPDDYWPASPHPAGPDDWDLSLRALREDRERLEALVLDPHVDLLALVPTGKDGQTVLRAILLVADHTAYHVGQLVAVRRALGAWR